MKCWELLPAYLIHLRADPLGSISLKVVPLCQLPFSVSDLCIMLTLPWYQEVDELEVVVGGRGRNRWGIKQNRKWVTVHSQDCCWGRLAVQSWQSPAVLQQMQVHLQSEMVWSRSRITRSKPNIETCKVLLPSRRGLPLNFSSTREGRMARAFRELHCSGNHKRISLTDWNTYIVVHLNEKEPDVPTQTKISTGLNNWNCYNIPVFKYVCVCTS